MNEAKLERAVRAKLEDWRGLLRAQVPQARHSVRKLVGERITFTQDLEARTYAFAAPATLS